MKNKLGRYLSTVPLGIWWISDKLEARKVKKDADTISNIARLHRLRERGAITEEEFNDLKARLLEQI